MLSMVEKRFLITTDFSSEATFLAVETCRSVWIRVLEVHSVLKGVSEGVLEDVLC